MFIEKIVLKKFGRFHLRSIDVFEYTPEKKTQVILGSNGSGKSSLLEELSPLPAESSDYQRGGSKEVWLNHRGKSYYLASLFLVTGNRFIFECDGENLNHSFNVTSYRDLVKEHFGYTKEIHQLHTGKVRFNQMSVNDRRSWFMTLSDIDYDYAFKYFKRLKEKHRSLVGALKETQERLAIEKTKQIKPEDEAYIREEIQRTKEELEYLLSIRPEVDSDNLHEQQRQLSDVNTALNDMLLSIESKLMKFELSSMNGATDKTLAFLIEEENRTIASLQGKLSVSYEAIGEIDKKLNLLKQGDGLALPAINEEIKSISNALSRIDVSKLQRYPRPSESLCTLDQYLPRILQILNDISLNTARCRGVSEAYSDALSRCKSLSLEISKLEESIKDLNERIRTLEAQKTPDIVCPKCYHTWGEEQKKSDIEKLASERERNSDKLTALKAEFENAKLSYSEISAYNQLREELMAVLYSLYEHTDLANRLVAPEILVDDPNTATAVIDRYRQSLCELIDASTLKEKLTKIQKTKEILETTASLDKARLEEQRAETDGKINTLLNQLNTATLRRNELMEEHQTRKHLKDCFNRLLSVMSDRKQKSVTVIKTAIRNAMNESVLAISVRKTGLEGKLSRIDMQNNLITFLESEVERLKIESRLLSLAIDELSPSSGLIARGMTESINNFIEDTNEFIGKIWSYPMSLSPLKLDEDIVELDYKFPVSVNGIVVSKDVEKTSEGMKEIIDLAFVIVSMAYRDMLDFPIYLDEFAVKMDAAHRSAAYRIIEYLTDSTDFTQIFIISHYENGYANLSNADISVLCSVNVDIPSHLKYNERVKTY